MALHKENVLNRSSHWLALASSLFLTLCAALPTHANYVDPPGRVARISDVRGDVAYSPAGEDVWLDVVRNRPLIRGDRVWTERRARVEIQVGSAAMRLGANTSFELLELNDGIAQVEVTQGSIQLRVRRLFRGQSVEVATPSLAFAIHRAGRYRIDVDPRSDRTTIVVWEGAGTAYGEHDNFAVSAGESVRFYGNDLSDYELFGLPAADAFDRYAFERDLRLDRSQSLRYVDDDLIGYADLDEYGTWRETRGYGMAWYPTQVSSDWAPYREGHWVWQEPWGWTWVDDAPWGFAPSHYGRWVYSGRWCWVPGPRNVRAVYAPALVAFVGGNNWSMSLNYGDRSPVGWFPLGPREVYVPSYHASRDYFTRININNTIVNNTTIVNVYNNYSSGGRMAPSMTYANRNVAGAVTAVPGDVFVNSRPVRESTLRMDQRAISSGEIARGAPIAPSLRSVLGIGANSSVRPSQEVLARQVIARTPPPPSERPFATRERQLQQDPGRPIALPPTTSRPDREINAHQNVRVLSGQRGNENARIAPAAGDPRATREVQPLDRDAVREESPPRGQISDDRGRGNPRMMPPTSNRAPMQEEMSPRGERPGRIDTRQQDAREVQMRVEDDRATAEREHGDRQRAVDQRETEARMEQQRAEQQREQGRETMRHRELQDRAIDQQQVVRQRDMEARQRQQEVQQVESENAAYAAEQHRAAQLQQQQQQDQQRLEQDQQRQQMEARQEQAQAQAEQREVERHSRAAEQAERVNRELQAEPPQVDRSERKDRERDNAEDDGQDSEDEPRRGRGRPDRGEPPQS